MVDGLTCERCGMEADKLYTLETKEEDEYGDEKDVIMKICWSCDFDITNGGDIHKDITDIIQDRRENAYEYDPINNPRPF